MQTAALFVISVNSECAAGMSLTCHGTDGRPFKKASNTAVKWSISTTYNKSN